MSILRFDFSAPRTLAQLSLSIRRLRAFGSRPTLLVPGLTLLREFLDGFAATLMLWSTLLFGVLAALARVGAVPRGTAVIDF